MDLGFYKATISLETLRVFTNADSLTYIFLTLTKRIVGLSFNESRSMPSAALQNTDYRNTRPSDGREHVVLETIVILLALVMIISGFSLYVGNALAENRDPQSSTVSHQVTVPTTEKPLSLAEI